MKVFNQHGSKERLFEMMQGVNKVILNENNFNPNDSYKVDDDYYDNDVSRLNKANNKGDIENNWQYAGDSPDSRKAPTFKNTKNPDVSWEFSPDKVMKNESTSNESNFKHIILRDDLGSYHFIKIPIESYEEHLDKLYHHFGTNSKYQDVDFNPSKEYKDSSEILGLNENSEEIEDISQEIYDELEMRYSPSLKGVPSNEFTEIANMYGVDEEEVLNIYSQVLIDMSKSNDEEAINVIKYFFDEKDLDFQKIHLISANDLYNEISKVWDVSDISTDDFNKAYDKLTKDPNQLKLFNESNFDYAGAEREYADRQDFEDSTDPDRDQEFKYDGKGNYLPIGYERNGVGIRPVPKNGFMKDMNHIVRISQNGEVEDFLDTGLSWEEAKRKVKDFLI